MANPIAGIDYSLVCSPVETAPSSFEEQVAGSPGHAGVYHRIG